MQVWWRLWRYDVFLSHGFGYYTVNSAQDGQCMLLQSHVRYHNKRLSSAYADVLLVLLTSYPEA
jgi:hypothetical protein